MNIDATSVRLLELPEDAVTATTRVSLLRLLVVRRSLTDGGQSALKNNRSFIPAVRSMIHRHVAEERGEDWSRGVRRAHKTDINALTEERPEVVAARDSLNGLWNSFFACFDLTEEQRSKMSRQISQIVHQKRKYTCIVDPEVLAEVGLSWYFLLAPSHSTSQREQELRTASTAFSKLRRKHRKNVTEITVKSVVQDAKKANASMAVRDQVIANMENKTPADALSFIEKNGSTHTPEPRPIEPRKPREEAFMSTDKAILDRSSIHFSVVLC
jgi:hypothetical protein